MKKSIYTPAYRNLIDRLRARRVALGLSQREAATRLRVQRTWLTRIEMCEIRLDIVQCVRICRTYGLSAPNLVRQLEGDLSDGDDPLYLLGFQRGGLELGMYAGKTFNRPLTRFSRPLFYTYDEFYWPLTGHLLATFCPVFAQNDNFGAN